MTFKFAIRDDDPNYFTDPEELEQAYFDLPDSVPISFAVVPFHGCTKTPAIPEERWNGDEEFPVGENEELVEYLRDRIEDNSAHIMLHGYNHVKYSQGPEFVAGDNLEHRVEKGRQYLEEVFSTDISIFVPPNNSFSRQGLSAVKDRGMNPFYYPTPLSRPKSPEVMGMTLRDLWFKYRHKDTGVLGFLKHSNRFWREKDRTVFMPVRPWTYSVQGNEEFNCVGMTRDDSIHDIKRQMDIADRYNGSFCLAIHYHSFRSERFRDSFYELIDYARSELDPEFVTADQIFG